MNEEIGHNYKKYSGKPKLLGILMKMHGFVLAQLNKKQNIKFGLEKMFQNIHPEYSNNMVNV